MDPTLEEFYVNPGRDVRPFAGQLEAAFQKRLQAAHAGVAEHAVSE